MCFGGLHCWNLFHLQWTVSCSVAELARMTSVVCLIILLNAALTKACLCIFLKSVISFHEWMDSFVAGLFGRDNATLVQY